MRGFLSRRLLKAIERRKRLAGTSRVLHGDALAMLDTIPSHSIQCCITSPPYWGLRDYHNDGVRPVGVEGSPQKYIGNLVKIFHKVRRCLHHDGTLWVVIGDCFVGGSDHMNTNLDYHNRVHDKVEKEYWQGLFKKNLVGIPWLLAFALQQDGWYLRADIVWHKPRTVPENVTDRPTRCHEYIFLLTKQPRYYYNHLAVKDGGINRRDVWSVNPHSNGYHPAEFPWRIVELCMLAGSRVGDTVLDPFAGSGTVGKVAYKLGRQSVMIELSSKYVQIIKRRLYHGTSSGSGSKGN